MRATARTGLAAIAAALLLWSANSSAQSPAPPSGGQQQQQSPAQQQQAETGSGVEVTGKEMYSLKLCNRSNRQSVFGAVAVYDNPGDAFVTIHAWFKVEKGNCSNVVTRSFGSNSSKMMYVFGQSDNFIWPPEKNGDLSLCVDRSRAYKRVNSKDYKCKSNEVLRKFRRLEVKRVPGDTAEFTYNFN